jgi:DNA-binding Lrp family transcriptional regulator
MKAFILINVRIGKVPEVLSKLRNAEGVKLAHACWSLPDVFALVETHDERALANLVLEKIQPIDGIESTDTHIVID